MRIRAVFDYLVGAFKEDTAFFKGLNASEYDSARHGGVCQNILSPRSAQSKGLPIAAE